MKIIKGLFTIILLCVLIISCKDAKKEEQPAAMEATETEAEAPEEQSEMKSEEKRKKQQKPKKWLVLVMQ